MQVSEKEPDRRRGRPPLKHGEGSTAISVRVTNRVYDEAYRIASQKRVSVSVLVRRALDHLIRDERG